MNRSIEYLCVHWLLIGSGWLVLTMAWRAGLGRGAEAKHRSAAITVLLLACVARLAVVFAGGPLLSDDIYRYMLDGEVLWAGSNPYEHSPAELATFTKGDASPRVAALTAKVNHPELVTVYQPTSQWVFAALAGARTLLEPEDASGLLTFRLGFVMVDLWLIALVLLWLVRWGRSPWWAALYALHPLALTETAGSGHQDVIGIAWLVMALMLVDERGLFANTTNVTSRVARTVLAGGAFALGIGVKPIVLPLALPLAWRARHDRAALVAAVGSTILTLVALYLPFAMMSGGLKGMIETARVFARDWTFNSAIYETIKAAVRLPWLAKLTCAAAVMAMMITQMRRGRDLWTIVLTYLFTALLLSSTCHPWYLLWALALVPVRPGAKVTPAVWVWSGTIGLSYIALLDVEKYIVPWWMLMIEYGVVIGVLIWPIQTPTCQTET